MRSLPPAIVAASLVLAAANPASADAVDTAVAAARGGAVPVRAELEQTAGGSAARQAAAGSPSHASIGHLVSICARAGEIVGSGPSVDAIFAAFLASPHHRTILTAPGWTAAGTGLAEGADGALYVSVVFCTESATPSPPPPPETPPEETPTGPAASIPLSAPAPTARVVAASRPSVMIPVILGPNPFLAMAQWRTAETPVVI